MERGTAMDDYRRMTSPTLNQVEFCDHFWAEYQRLVREVVIPYQWDALNDRVEGADKSHAVENFKIAAGLSQGEFYGAVFQDSDVAKWLEAVAYSLTTHPDAKLEQIADGMIDIIEKAQQPDGYLNTYFTMKEPEKRFTNLHDCHELYCAGHMLEAAVAYYNATGKRKLLNVMCRFVDCIDRIFGPEPEKLKGYPGHQEIELALLKLYRITGDQKHLNLARYFLLERGKKPYYFDIEWERRGKTDYWSSMNNDAPGKNAQYNQFHLPVYEQTAAVGHAVRAVYMYTAMADLACEDKDEQMLNACHRLWDDIVNRQMYLTGGIGATNIGEAFTFDYDLPNETNYSETCASIGLIFFASRMLRMEAKGIYADVIERALYNTVIASMSRDGNRFFYVNPMEVWPEASEKNPTRNHVKPVRQPWFGCACCPPNLARLIASLGQYIYTTDGSTVYCHLYIGNSVKLKLDDSDVGLTMTTDYPWSGRMHFGIHAGGTKFTLALRIPGWCRNYTLEVNGENCRDYAIQNGYLFLSRIWKQNDSVDLIFDMPVEYMEANPKVRADAGKTAIMRGPLVYCLEEADNGPNLSAITIPIRQPMVTEFDSDFCGGAVLLHGSALRTEESGWENSLYRPIQGKKKEIRVTAVPYFLWGNRTPGEMKVWMNAANQ